MTIEQVKVLLESIQDEYKRRLQAKNGWGKDEVYNLYLETVTACVFKEMLKAANPPEPYSDDLPF
jgi:hypothetical protein